MGYFRYNVRFYKLNNASRKIKKIILLSTNGTFLKTSLKNDLQLIKISSAELVKQYFKLNKYD